MDRDTLITNIFIDLATKGTLSDAFLNRDILLKHITIERKIYPTGGQSPFPADIILYSKKYTYFLVLEMKNTASSSLDVTQAKGYGRISPATTFKYVSLNPSQIRFDVSYMSEEQFRQHVSNELSIHNFNYPILSVDLTTFSISFTTPAQLKVPKINQLLNSGISLNVTSLGEIPRHINFGVDTSLDQIGRVAVVELIAQVQKTGSEVSAIEITESSFSNVSFLWSLLDPAYKANLKSRVKTALTRIKESGVPLQSNGENWFVDIFDSNQRVSQPKIAKLQSEIQTAIDHMSAQPSLFDTVA